MRMGVGCLSCLMLDVDGESVFVSDSFHHLRFRYHHHHHHRHHRRRQQSIDHQSSALIIGSFIRHPSLRRAMTSSPSTISSTLPVTLIVAATTSNGIGQAGSLPWRLPKEMKYFAQITSGGPRPAENEAESDSIKPNAVIMGRKTWDGIPPKFRPLKDRQNLVISRSNSVDISSSNSASSPTSLHSSLPSALSSLSPSTTNRVFLIGGAQIYRQALLTTPPLISRILLTRITSPTFECDAFLEEFRELEKDDGGKLWRKASGEELKQWAGWDVEVGETVEKGVTYEFEMWVLNT